MPSLLSVRTCSLQGSPPGNELRTPSLVIGVLNDSTQTSEHLSLGAELTIALQCLAEVRHSFSVDVDPDQDGHVDVLLYSRVATLALPSGVLQRPNLERALLMVSSANVAQQAKGGSDSGSIVTVSSRR